MATTTNYGWTTPDNTALVKDGASAIRALGTAIDTSMNTALGTKKAGMVLLNTTSFTGQATQSINDVFSATYTNYRIMINASQISAFQINLRLRASGTDATGSNYKQQFNRLDSVGTNNGTVSTTTSMSVTFDTIAKGVASIDVFNPFVAASTQFLFLSGVNNGARMGLVEHQVSTAYDGFTIFTAGTMTGNVSVYGYNA